MPYFSERSLDRLGTCHNDLVVLFREFIKTMDCSIICGTRSEEAQEQAYRENRSQKHYPYSLHNGEPSMAVDIAPYPINFDNRERFLIFGATIMQIARQLHESGMMSHRLRWGGDFKDELKDKDVKASWDPGHFEILSLN